MSTIEQAREIDIAISGWSTMVLIEKARAVLQWCRENNIETELTDIQVNEAMGEFPYWASGAVNYLDFILAYQIAVRHSGGVIKCPNCSEELIINNDQSLDGFIK